MLARMLAALALVAVALGAALAVLPARWLIRMLPASWPVAVIDASGSVWNGSALVALGPPGARTTLPQPVSWQTGWQGGLRMQLRHPWLGCTLGLRPTLGGLGISPCTLRLPAAALAAVGAPLNTVQPAGQLALRWPGLQLRTDGAVPDGELLTLDWTEAGSALSRVRPLGHYRVVLNGSGGNTVNVTLTTVEGALVMQGSGSFTQRTGLRFKGTAAPAPDAPPQTQAGLQAMLSAIGRRSGNDTLLQIGR